MKLHCILLGMAIVALLPLQQAIACDGKVDVGATVIMRGYSPFDAVDKRHTVEIAVENLSSEPCRFGLGFERSASDAKLGGILTYRFMHDSIDLFAEMASAESPVIAVDVDGGQRKRLSAEVVIPRGQYVAPGQYRAGAHIYLYSIKDSRVQKVEARKIEFVQEIEPEFSISVAGGGQKTTMDFGVLAEGAEKSVKLRARSNTDYKLVVASDNDGKMILTPPVTGRTWSVGYAAKLDGTQLALNSGETSTSAISTQSGGYVDHDLDVTIKETEDKRAGTYKDILTIVIEAASP